MRQYGRFMSIQASLDRLPLLMTKYSLTGSRNARAQTTANTVMQTSSVASENCSFMPASLPPAQQKSPPTLAPERLGNTPLTIGGPWSAGARRMDWRNQRRENPSIQPTIPIAAVTVVTNIAAANSMEVMMINIVHSERIASNKKTDAANRLIEAIDRVGLLFNEPSAAADCSLFSHPKFSSPAYCVQRMSPVP
jgi:hypothetical protein